MARHKRSSRWEEPRHGMFAALGASTLIEVLHFRSKRLPIALNEYRAIVAPPKLVSYEAAFDRSVVFHAPGGDIVLAWDFPTNGDFYDVGDALDGLGYGDAVDIVQDAGGRRAPWADRHGHTLAGLQLWLREKIDGGWAADWFPHHPFERLPGFEIFDALKPAVCRRLGMQEADFGGPASDGVPCVVVTCSSIDLQAAIDCAGLPFQLDKERYQ